MNNSAQISGSNDPSDNDTWSRIAAEFSIRSGTTYLNHGSFGIPPKRVIQVHRDYQDQLNDNPMDFFLEQFEPLMANAKTRLAGYLGTSADDLVFVDNPTYAMSVIAAQFRLNKGDQVILTDQEYVPVARMWQQRCDQSGAELVTAKLLPQMESIEHVVQSLVSQITPHTRLVVVSQITSPTGLILPVKEICKAFSDREIATCVDGPHALAQVELNIDQLNCDFYTANCHKWLCAPHGTGFLYVHPRRQSEIEPLIKGWGRLPPGKIEKWSDNFLWPGTRDVSNFLAIPAAIDFLSRVGFEHFRNRSRWLATYAENGLRELFGTEPIARRADGWYGSMAHVPLPPGDWSQLAKTLRENYGIEVVVNQFDGRWFVRVSCHLYNNTSQLDLLTEALAENTVKS